jgi:hypothetical protein
MSQKKDKRVLEAIKECMDVRTNIRYNKGGFYQFDVTHEESLRKVKKFFFEKMKGIKSLDYRRWARSFKHKGKKEKLLEVQRLLRSVRNEEAD